MPLLPPTTTSFCPAKTGAGAIAVTPILLGAPEGRRAPIMAVAVA